MADRSPSCCSCVGDSGISKAASRLTSAGVITILLEARTDKWGCGGRMADDREYTKEVVARRAEEVIKRMLNTPPKPRRAKQQPTEAKERPGRKARSKPPS